MNRLLPLLLLVLFALPCTAEEAEVSGTIKINGVEVPFVGTVTLPERPEPPTEPPTEPPVEPPTDPPPTQPPTPGTEIPTALRTVEVTPQNWQDTLGSAARAEPGTHFVLQAGTYDMENQNLGGTFNGTAENPIVIRGEGARIVATSWSQGIHGAVWKLKGSHVIIAGLEFGACKGGRHINVISNPWIVSEDWKFLGCTFTESWNHSVVVQGKGFMFDSCEWRDNCLRNKDGTLGLWPYVVGTWAYFTGDDSETVSENVTFRNCVCVHNYGEGIHPSYVRGATVEGCTIADNRFVNLYFNNASQIVCRNNRLVSESLMLTRHGEPPRGIEFATESLYPSATNHDGNVPVEITGNLIDGGEHKGIRRGITWSKHEGNAPWNRYAEVTIRGNTIRNCKESRIEFDAIPSATSYGNTIDEPLDAPGVEIADSQWWEVVE